MRTIVLLLSVCGSLLPFLCHAENHDDAILRSKSSTTVITPDWSCSFDTEADFLQFTTIDCNKDAWAASQFSWGIWDYLFRSGSSPYGDDYPNQCVGYTNSEDNDGDDWLITPPLHLQAGATYELKFRLRVHRERSTERLELRWGNTPTAEAMTNIIMPATDYNNETWQEISQTIIPQSDGNYYIGFHALSNTYSMILYIDDIAVVKSKTGIPPAAVNDLKLIPDNTGALSATISFTAPSLATDNTELTTNLGVKVTNGDVLIADRQDITPGTVVNVPITEGLSRPDTYTYTIQPYNNYGNGTQSKISGWIGLDIPQKPLLVTVKPSKDNIYIEWDASIAEHGGVLFPDKIQYGISSMKDALTPIRLLKTITGETQANLDINPLEGEQQKLFIAIKASNETGSSNYTMGNPIMIGKPYEVPFLETFSKEGNNYSFWGTEGTGFGFENNYAGVQFSTDEDCNGDGGSAYIQTYLEDSVAIVSGKISLKKATSPVFTYSQKTAIEKGQIIPFIITPENKVIELNKEDLSTYESKDVWTSRQYDLSAYKNYEYIQVGIALDQKEVYYKQQGLYLDNFFVGDLEKDNLQVSLYIPGKVRKGKPSHIKYVVNNYGQTVDSYSIQLKVGDTILKDETISSPIENLGCDTYEVEFIPDALCESGSTLVSAIVSADKGVTEKTASKEFVILSLQRPAPTNLKATQNAEGKVVLTWTECEQMPSLTDTFEDYNPWAIDNSIGDWDFIDADKGLTYGYFDDRGVYYENEKTPFAFIVWVPTNYSGLDITKDNPTVKPFSGTQALASVYSYHLNTQTKELTPLDADNWLISPELTGQEQTISFRVNNYGPAFAETYEVLYSKTGKEQTDFMLLEEKTISSGQWDLVEFTLPDGAKYFAIRHTTKVIVSPTGIGYASSPYLLMLDDITYSSLANVLDSYNVYKDGVLIGNVTAAEYADTVGSEVETHRYSITAVFADKSESEPVSVSYETTNGINLIYESPQQETVIYTIDGKKIPAGQLKSLYPGVYIINNKKVIIK